MRINPNIAIRQRKGNFPASNLYFYWSHIPPAMNRQIEKDLPELIAAGILTEETAERIKKHYRDKSKDASGRLILVYGVLGALLVGLGIVLIIAHNWDQLARGWKLAFALIPLLAGQILCGFTLIRYPHYCVLREGTAVFLFSAVAASMAIVSQVYHLPDDLSMFLFTWMLLCLPLIYLMQSSMTSLLYIIGITAYAFQVSYLDPGDTTAWYYWLMLGAVVPFAWKQTGNFAVFHRWAIALSLVTTLGMFPSKNGFLTIAYMGMFSLFVLTSQDRKERIRNNAFLAVGNLGAVILLFLCTFEFFWRDVGRGAFEVDEGFLVAVLINVVAAIALVRSIRRHGDVRIHPAGWLFILFAPVFVLAQSAPLVLPGFANAALLAVAVMTTLRGARQDSMWGLNFGLMILALLILCRFLDTNMTFVVRGILFLCVGLSFFGANYWVLRKRKVQKT